MKRVWKPLSINYLRLYEVKMEFSHEHRDWNRSFICAAKSPSDAASIISRIYRGAQWWGNEEPTFQGHALKIYQPEYWDGAVVDKETAIHPVFGKVKDLKLEEWGIG